MAENVFQRKSRELGGIRLDDLKRDVDELLSFGGSGGTSDHGGLSGLSDDDHSQYLTQSRADQRYYTQEQVDELIPETAQFWDSNARRWGCKALSFTPHDVNPDDPQALRLAQNRMYVVGLSLPPGEQVSFVRIPIVEKMVNTGELEFRVYNQDMTLISSTGNVSSSFSSGNDQTWRQVDLQSPGNTTGGLIYICLRSTAANADNILVLFPDVSSPGTVPSWLYETTGMYIDDIAVMPNTLDLASAQPYYDILIGIG